MRTTRTLRSGVTLIEVLAAIFIMGVGLLALLTLFPLGALSMARAVQDDRAAAIAADAVTLGNAGSELLIRTRQFGMISVIRGSADRQAAARLRQEYEHLGGAATDLERRLQELRTQLPNLDAKVQAQFDLLLAQIRTIESLLAAIADLLGLLEQGL